MNSSINNIIPNITETKQVAESAKGGDCSIHFGILPELLDWIDEAVKFLQPRLLVNLLGPVALGRLAEMSDLDGAHEKHT